VTDVRTDTATVLFTDVVGSTELRSRVGEERADELRRRHDDVVEEAIARNRGTVVKHLGDGMMATFTGSADAVGGAIAVQQAIAVLNGAAGSEQIAVRIGISVGDVSFEGDDCFGLPVVEAQRLESAAGAGQIFCSNLVQLMSRGRGGHEFLVVGDLELKGLVEPVSVMEVVWARAPATESELELPNLLSTAASFDFAGRKAELQQLVDAWEGLGESGHAAVLVSGEPGIGKTRLVAELAKLALSQGGTVVAGRCDDSADVPFRPFVEALRGWCSGLGSEEVQDVLGPAATDLQRIFPELESYVSGLAVPQLSDPDFERYQVLGAIVSWLRSMTEEGPVLVVLDDIHWADSATLAALKNIVEELVSEPVLIVGTYRDTDLDRGHPLAAALADFRRIYKVTRLDLRGLTQDDVTAFMTLAAGHELDAAGGDLATALHRETAGNPFFVGEVLRHLIESEVIVFRDGAWTSDMTLDELGIPEGIREVVGRRLTVLDEQAEKMLVAASVLGHEFEVDVLSAVAGIDPDDVLDLLDTVVAANLAVETGTGWYRFTYALVRSTLLDELSATRRARLHRRAAQEIERRNEGRLDVVTTRIAFHWAETADPDPSTAVLWATRSGQVALHRAAADDAVRWFERGLDLLDPDDPNQQQQAVLLVGLAESQLRNGLSGFDDTAKRAARIGLALRDPQIVSDALRVNGRTIWTRSFDFDQERMELIRAGLELDLADTPGARASLLIDLGQELLFTGEADERLRVCTEALTILEHAGADQLKIRLIIHRLSVALPPLATPAGVRDRVNELYRQAAEASEKAGDSTLQFRFLQSLTVIAIFENDHATFQRCLPVVDRLRSQVDRFTRAGFKALDIIVGLALGKLAEAEAGADELLESLSSKGDEAGTQYHAMTYFQTYRERTALNELLPLIEDVTIGESDYQGASAAMKASAYATIGRTQEVITIVDHARPFDDLADDSSLPVVLAGFADAISLTGNSAAAADLLPRLRELERADQDIQLSAACFYFGSLDAAMARVLSVLGEDGEAEQRFTSGIAASDNFGATAWSARSRVHYAQFCLDRGRDSDAARIATEAIELTEGTELTDTQNIATTILERTKSNGV